VDAYELAPAALWMLTPDWQVMRKAQNSRAHASCAALPFVAKYGRAVLLARTTRAAFNALTWYRF